MNQRAGSILFQSNQQIYIIGNALSYHIDYIFNTYISHAEFLGFCYQVLNISRACFMN